MKVIFHPDARAEFLHDIRYYAEQRRGLGIQFRTVVEELIQHILVNPGTRTNCGGKRPPVFNSSFPARHSLHCERRQALHRSNGTL